MSGGIITTLAGNGTRGFSGDGGPITSALLNQPTGVAVDSAGSVYIADRANYRIRKVAGGTMTTVAGNGRSGTSGDGGPATNAPLISPTGVAVDSAGNLYIADTYSFRIRKVSGGIITTVAGNGTAEFSGDGGPAVNASLKLPTGIAVDSAGNLYIADISDHRIRKVSGGNITTVAGNGRPGFSGDGGSAVNASLNFPTGVAVDSTGNLYIADNNNNRIRRVSGGIITTMAGGDTKELGDGGPATSASLNTPYGVALDSMGNLYIADTNNDRIREVLASASSFQVSPAALTFSVTANGQGGSPQTVNLTSTLPGLVFTTSSGASWLSVTPSGGTIPAALQVSVDPSLLSAENYAGTIAITAPNAVPPTQNVTVSVAVAAAQPGKLGLTTQSLSFSLTQGASKASVQLTVSNLGSGSISFSTTAATSTGGNWLQVTPSSGTTTPSTPVPLTVAATPGDLAAGTYSGSIVVSSASTRQSITVPVTLAVSAIQSKLLLSQTGMTFTGVVQGGAPLPQSFGILNTGQGAMSWSAKSSTLSGGSWLSIDQTSGTVSAPYTDVALVNMSIDASKLAAGDYYGRVQVEVPGAPNSPQTVSVILNVLPLGSNAGAEVRPTGLIFIGQAGSSPGSQKVVVSNPTNIALTFGSSRTTLPSGGNWFVNLPSDATIQPNVPEQIVIQPDYSRLSPGTTNRGFLNLGFQDGTSRNVSILTVVAPEGTNLADAKRADRQASGCSPKSLSVLPTALNDFSATVALLQPATLSVRVIDNCGTPVTSSGGGVSANFTNGDAPVTLVHVGDGRWNGTWQPRNGIAGSQVTVQFVGILANVSVALAGMATLTVTLRSGAATPVTYGAGNSASGVGTFISPGGLVSIFGQQLADRDETGRGTPFPTVVNGTQVLMGGRPLPLRFVGNGQINAQVPFELGINTEQQLVVQRGNTLSVPQDVVVAAAQPAVYTIDQSGRGPGVVVNGITNAVITPSSPVRVGDVIIIYCNGLGAVNPQVPSGTPAPPTGPLSRTANDLKVTVGGVQARVDFAGLAPGYPDLYQVNAVIPAGVAAGDAVGGSVGHRWPDESSCYHRSAVMDVPSGLMKDASHLDYAIGAAAIEKEMTWLLHTEGVYPATAELQVIGAGAFNHNLRPLF